MTGRTSVGPNPMSTRLTKAPGAMRGQVISTKSMELARNFLASLFMGLRTSQLHDPSNKAFDNAVRQVRDAAQALVVATGGFSIQFVEESAFLNGARIRFEGGVFESMRKLRSILETRELGGIEMQSVPTYSAVQTLLLMFSQTPSKESEAARNELAGQQINVLGVQRFADGQGGLKIDRRIFAAQCYAKLILSLREQLERAQAAAGGEPVRAPRLRAVRVVQDLVELCGDRMDFLLRLGMNRAGSDAEELLGANTCVLAIALGHAAGISRQDLVDIGMAALFHRVSVNPEHSEQAERERSRAAFGRLMAAGRFGRSGYLRAVIAAEQGVASGERLPWGGTRPRPHVYARLTGVAATYARLTLGLDPRSPRALDPLDALGRMRRDRSGKNDPVFVDLLINLLRAYPVGIEVHLDSGEQAVVRSQVAGSRWDRPVVSVLGDPPRRIDLMRQENGRFVSRVADTLYPPESLPAEFEEPDVTAEEDMPLVVPVSEGSLQLEETVTRPSMDLTGAADLDVDPEPTISRVIAREAHGAHFDGDEIDLELDEQVAAENILASDVAFDLLDSQDALELEPLVPLVAGGLTDDLQPLDLEGDPADAIELEPLAASAQLHAEGGAAPEHGFEHEPTHTVRLERTDPMARAPTEAPPPPRPARARGAAEGGSKRPELGSKLLGRYQIEGDLAGAAPGDLRGRDLRDGSEVRIKLIDLSAFSAEAQQAAVLAYEREARAAAVLAHPALPRLVDCGAEGPLRCLVYEPSWGESLSRIFTAGVPMAPIRVRRIVRGLAEALHHVHQRNLVHGDVSINVVRVAPGDRASLATLERVSPVDRTAGWDDRMDQRALGVLLAELLTGSVPSGREASALKAALSSDDALAIELAEIAERMLDPEPSKRFASCEIVALRLTRARRDLA